MIMNNTTTNKILKYAIIFGLAVVPFIPLYVENSFFFPFITGKGFAFRIITEIVFALWLILILREKGTSTVGTHNSVIPQVNSLTFAVTAFTIIALVADLFGLSPLRSMWSNFERMEGWIIIVHLWAYFMVLSSVINTRDNWRMFFNVVLGAGFITAVYGLYQFLGWAETHQGSRVDASLGNSAYMAVYMLINAFISAYMAVSYFSKKHHLVWVYTILFAFLSFIMFQTATRGTILGWIAAILVSCAIYLVFGKKGKGQSDTSRLIVGGVILLFFITGGLFFKYKDTQFIKGNAVLGRLATISISDTKTQARGYIWPMAVKSIFESPKTTIIGVGQENFNYIFNSHYNPQMWRHEQWFDRAHSVYLDWLVAGGLIGLISYLALYLIALLYIIKSDISIAQKSVLIGLLVGYGIHNIFVFDNQTSYVMFMIFLAFVHSLKSGKTLSIFKNFTKQQSEDDITIRDYIYLPIILIALASSLYFINIRPIQSNKLIITGLSLCQNIQAASSDAFAKSLSLDQTIANQEAREQLLSCASRIITSQQAPEKLKIDFYNLVKKEVDNQIKSTPNDARIYIIAGGFFNSIRDFNSATPLLEKANTLSPNKQTIMMELAANYISIGKKQEAVDIMEKAYSLSTDHEDVKLGYASTMIAAGQDTKAYKVFENDKSIFSNPKIINAYVYTKQFGKAVAVYKDLIKSDPNNQELYTSLAYVYLLSHQDSLAIETLRSAGEKFPISKSQVDTLINQIKEGKFKSL
jgi:O-antigen ligase/Flp pilus assembly protein TadD